MSVFGKRVLYDVTGLFMDGVFYVCFTLSNLSFSDIIGKGSCYSEGLWEWTSLTQLTFTFDRLSWTSSAVTVVILSLSFCVFVYEEAVCKIKLLSN